MSVYLSVCSSVDTWVHYFVRTSPRYPSMDFVFHCTYKEHILELCSGVLFLKNGDFWGLSVIIGGSLYGQVLGYPSMDFVFLWHIDRIYIGAVHRRFNFWKIFKMVILANIWKMVIWGLRQIKKDVLRKCCRKDVVRKTLWERLGEKDVMKKTLWEIRCEKDVTRTTLWERHSFNGF